MNKLQSQERLPKTKNKKIKDNITPTLSQVPKNFFKVESIILGKMVDLCFSMEKMNGVFTSGARLWRSV